MCTVESVKIRNFGHPTPGKKVPSRLSHHYTELMQNIGALLIGVMLGSFFLGVAIVFVLFALVSHKFFVRLRQNLILRSYEAKKD